MFDGLYRCGGGINLIGLRMLVEVMIDGFVCIGICECRYLVFFDFGIIEIRGGGLESIFDFVVGIGFNGDL